MKRKLLATLLTLIMVIGITTSASMAATVTPTTIGAPEHFGIKHYSDEYFVYTFSAPDDLRTIIDNSDPNKVFVIRSQVDYKLGDGNWHYTSSWDKAGYTLKNTLGFAYERGICYTYQTRASLSTMFPEDSAALQGVKDSGWNIPEQAISFRVRFVTSFDSNKTFVYSGWSDTYVYAKDVVKDPDVLINHAPSIISAEIKNNTAGKPNLYLRTAKQPDEVLDLNAMVGSGMRTEIWLRKAGDTEFKKIGDTFFTNEYFYVDVTRYFDKVLPSYDAESYEIKIRYMLNDLGSYPQTGRSDIIYSPFSNVYSQNMPAWNTSRLSGASRIETAIAISKEGWPNGADAVILTRDDNYPDALTGTPLSKKLDAPILFTGTYTLTEATKAEITRLNVDKVIILGGTGAVSQNVENQLRQNYEVKRLGGADRYETAAKIAQELGYHGKAVITTGEDFHDALVVAPLAAYKGIPILLTLPDSLPSSTNSALQFVAPDEITVVGNTSWVSDGVFSQLSNAKRITGADYYRTAIVVANNFGADPSRIFFATGKDFPDALAGSALAAKYNSPIFFVNDPITDEVKQYMVQNKGKTTNIHLLGGEGVIPANVKSQIDQVYQ